VKPSDTATEKAALDWLYSTQFFGMKLGLENTRKLLAALDLPAPQQRFIHVAGTNGKGSVCAFMHSILRESGVNAGLFTSPHLIQFRERIQDTLGTITPQEICSGISRIRAITDAWDPHPTFFEITLGLALDWFRQRSLPWCVLETGLGGRLDATNVVTPAVSVITPIGLDHTAILGETLSLIAAEKAGIIKPGIPVVTAPQHPEAMAVLKKVAAERGSPLTVVEEPCRLPLGLIGDHQTWNAALALAALKAAGLDLSDKLAAEGLLRTQWPARFQRLDPHTILDGAHNPHAADVLVKAWKHEFGNEKATVIFGASSGKDTAAILQILAPIVQRWIFTGFRSQRALSPEAVAELVSSDAEKHIADNIESALQIAAPFHESRLITGSLYFAGEVLAHHRAVVLEPSDQ
jgi:dihydrofolate synthase / folylpolyglutamate synthase